jgi:hypothetical protein
MRRSFEVIAVVLLLVAGIARADAEILYGPSGSVFKLPDGITWALQPKGDVTLIEDDSQTLPDLMVAVFAASKDGTIGEIEGRLTSEITARKLEFFMEKAASFKLDKASTETLSGTPVRIGRGKLNQLPAAFAIVHRPKKTVILIGVGKSGVEERALSNFDAIVRSLGPVRLTMSERAEPTPSRDPETMPMLESFVVVKSVTATSTFVDKTKKDLYGAWRTLAFETVADETRTPKTAWCEGKPDEGIGEGITIELATPTKVDEIQIAAGVWLTPKLYAVNNQPTTLSVSLDGGPATKLKIAAREWAVVKTPKAVSSIRVTVDSVKKGKTNDTCISAVQLMRGGDPVGVVLDPRAASALPAAYTAVWDSLASGQGLDKVAAFPLPYSSSNWFFEGSQKPVTYQTAKAATAACKANKPTCPGLPTISTNEANPTAFVSATTPDTVKVVFPGNGEVVDVWTMRWANNAWKLTSSGYASP